MYEHEESVAALCSKFLKRTCADMEAWGDLLGRWHDLGKYSDEFQKYLAEANNIERLDLHGVDVSGKVDHSTAAAQLAVNQFGLKGQLIAYPLAGHHAGLPDWDDGMSMSGLKQRLAKPIPKFESNAPKTLLEKPLPLMFSLPPIEEDEYKACRASFRVVFRIRMMFSCLVDADFLATESFMAPERKVERVKKDVTMADMFQQVESSVASIQSKAADTNINRIRMQIGEACISKATLPPGLFSLDVPTGGGKTIAGLRFAAKHAVENQLDRIVVAIPFTSIIEQNADVYRDILEPLGENVVIEHHSNLDPQKETTTNRLQTENWDAPLIVTTNVQLFESLFACRTSQCRKLHRIASSVIILDEAQTLPVDLLKPTLFAIRELVEVYGCTVVICTATQPALNYRDDFKIGLKSVTPIIDDAKALYRSLKRVRVNYIASLSDCGLSGRIEEANQVLCIVNTRAHAASIFQNLAEDESNFHLSTRMCAAHRKNVLDREIRPRLSAGVPCKVVSTQLIEAGVDVDFPIVYRAITGLDSLAQAAGRCNREGALESGEVYFFDTETPPPVGSLRQMADSAKELLGDYEDLLSIEAIQHYFQLHYWKKSDSWDQQKVMDSIGNQPNQLQFNFREVAQKYQFIREVTQAVLIPWDVKSQDLITQLSDTNAKLDYQFWRQLQRYAVQVRDYELIQLQQANAVELLHERWVLIQDHLYDKNLGLVVSRADGFLPAESTVF